MTKITVHRVGDRDLNALYERVKEVAEAQGITKEDGVREALLLWLERLGEAEPWRVLDVTDREAMAIEAVLTAIREAKT